MESVLQKITAISKQKYELSEYKFMQYGTAGFRTKYAYKINSVFIIFYSEIEEKVKILIQIDLLSVCSVGYKHLETCF